MTVVMMIVLLGLGTWQVKRLFWKQDILAQIERAESAPPVPLAKAGVTQFTKVSVTGTFLPSASALYGAEVRDIQSGPAMGAHLIEPMRETNGDVILVDRGWVPITRTGPLNEPAGATAVAGYVRLGDLPAWFSATDDPAARRFFTLNPKAIGEAIGQPHVRPFVIVALAADAPAGAVVTNFPDAAQHLPRPPNNHLSYAITWYGLAVALLAIFMVWARKGSRA